MSLGADVSDLCGDGSHVYLILDGALQNVPKLVYQYDDSPELVELFRGTRHEAALSVSPCLVAPSGPSKLWNNEALWRRSGVVAVSDYGLKTMAEHFRSLLMVSLEGRDLAYLRFYSPALLPGLLAAFTDRERSEFSGPVKEWRFWSEVNGWERATSDAKAPFQSRDEGWFDIADHHLKAVSQQRVARFQNRLLGFLGLTVTPENEQLVEALCWQAQSLNIESEAGMAGYCELAMTYPEQVKGSSVTSVLAEPGLPDGTRLQNASLLLAHGGAR